MNPAKLAAYGDQDTEAIEKAKMVKERLAGFTPIRPLRSMPCTECALIDVF
jgi:hypothetical protein